MLHDEQAQLAAMLSRVEATINRLASPATIPSLPLFSNGKPTSLAIASPIRPALEFSGFQIIRNGCRPPVF